MNTIRSNTFIAALFLSTCVAGLHTAPASAMGRSGAPSSRPTAGQHSSAQTAAGQQAQSEDLEAQVAALRKEVDELKTRMSADQGEESVK